MIKKIYPVGLLILCGAAAIARSSNENPNSESEIEVVEAGEASECSLPDSIPVDDEGSIPVTLPDSIPVVDEEYTPSEMPDSIIDSEPIVLDCDTVKIMDGYRVHLIVENGVTQYEGLDLFSEEMKQVIDRALLEYIEQSLFNRASTGQEVSDRLKITKGKISDFKEISQNTPFNVNNDSKEMRVEWQSGGKATAISIPISYETLSSGNRSEIENRFISRLRSGNQSRKPLSSIDISKMEAYGDSLYILPGGIYRKKEINRNSFYLPDSKRTPLWSVDYPLESMANLFILPSPVYSDVELELTVLKHEYGDKETFPVRLDHFLSICEADGCVPFWGVEKFKDGKLHGALFLYNYPKGYDHVLRIEMTPEEIISGNGKVKATASLFIPTNNIGTLYEPYRKKSEKEKIRYDKFK